MADFFTLLLSNGKQYPYKINHSIRAKYIRIKLSQYGDLSVTIPQSTQVKYAHQFINSKIVWIEKNLANVKIPEEQTLPTHLELNLLNEAWAVLYLELKNKGRDTLELIEKEDKVIELQGSFDQINSPSLVSKVLNKWCKNKAKNQFNTMLQELAELHGFHYQRLTIRTQKTRWGSCSSQKNINLNSKLLFMPEEVVRYVMIHELCHTIEMNHSSRFWRLVEDCDPEFRMNKKILKELSKSINI